MTACCTNWTMVGGDIRVGVSGTARSRWRSSPSLGLWLVPRWSPSFQREHPACALVPSRCGTRSWTAGVRPRGRCRDHHRAVAGRPVGSLLGRSPNPSARRVHGASARPGATRFGLAEVAGEPFVMLRPAPAAEAHEQAGLRRQVGPHVHRFRGGRTCRRSKASWPLASCGDRAVARRGFSRPPPMLDRADLTSPNRSVRAIGIAWSTERRSFLPRLSASTGTSSSRCAPGPVRAN